MNNKRITSIKQVSMIIGIIMAILFPIVGPAQASSSKNTIGQYLSAYPTDHGYSVGDTLFFGFYEQDNKKSNGKEPIEWIVIEIKEDSSLLLVSSYALDAKPYNETDTSVSWENCTLRTWLNNDFYNAAFSDAEKTKIINTLVVDDYGDEGLVSGSTDTEDNVWLLSVTEATNGYFKNNASRWCSATRYALSQGAWQNGLTVWWLRSPSPTGRPAVVDNTGTVLKAYYGGYGYNITSDSVSVRPVICIQPDFLTVARSEDDSTLSKYKVGEYVLFGNYEQDNDFSNGAERIEWLVIEVNDDGTLLLISRYALDCKPYNSEYSDVTWETCTLRSWLNNDFYNIAFTEAEKAIILTTYIKNEDNPRVLDTGGNDTEDKVWLLSINEIRNNFLYEGYFMSDSAKKCAPTTYAIAQGARSYYNRYYHDWWLRSPGDGGYVASSVDYDGKVNYYYSCKKVDDESVAVRPVIYVQTSTNS